MRRKIRLLCVRIPPTSKGSSSSDVGTLFRRQPFSASLPSFLAAPAPQFGGAARLNHVWDARPDPFGYRFVGLARLKCSGDFPDHGSKCLLADCRRLPQRDPDDVDRAGVWTWLCA